MKLDLDKFKGSVAKYLLGFLQAQLVVFFVSIPILVGWGLQISIMTFVGNLIFLPVLILFLIVSSLVFFTQLCRIPNGFLIKILEVLSYAWSSVLSLGHKSWLFGFCLPNFWVLLFIPITSFLILYLIRSKSMAFKTYVMLVNFVIVFVGLEAYSYFLSSNKEYSFDEGRLVVAIDKNRKVNIFDNGFFSGRSSHDKLVGYELKQFLVKNTGGLSVRALHLSGPGFRTFKAAQECCLQLNVDNLFLPYFKGKLTKNAWREFFKLKRVAGEKGVCFLRAEQ